MNILQNEKISFQYLETIIEKLINMRHILLYKVALKYNVD